MRTGNVIDIGALLTAGGVEGRDVILLKEASTPWMVKRCVLP